MKRLILTMGIGLAACGGSSAGNGDGNGNGPDPDYIDSGVSTDLFLASTNAQGATGCSLTDPTANPGQAVSRVMYTLLDDFGQAPPVCGPKASAIGAKATGSFERWDANGTKTDSVKALGGAASFASSAAGADLWRCDVTITLTFPGGGVFTDAFSYNYNRYGGITTACIQGEACKCQPWQGCDAQNQCVDLACVPLQQTCPADGSVGCCGGSCNDGKCCYPAGTACTPGTTGCCYSCDFLDNPVYHGWYCTHP